MCLIRHNTTSIYKTHKTFLVGRLWFVRTLEICMWTRTASGFFLPSVQKNWTIRWNSIFDLKSVKLCFIWSLLFSTYQDDIVLKMRCKVRERMVAIRLFFWIPHSHPLSRLWNSCSSQVLAEKSDPYRLHGGSSQIHW
jgi:hypothetical protein